MSDRRFDMPTGGLLGNCGGYLTRASEYRLRSVKRSVAADKSPEPGWVDGRGRFANAFRHAPKRTMAEGTGTGDHPPFDPSWSGEGDGGICRRTQSIPEVRRGLSQFCQFVCRP